MPNSSNPDSSRADAPLDPASAEDALRKIINWCNAYPIDLFGEPDLPKIESAIGPIELSKLHAAWARHLLTGISTLAKSGLGIPILPSPRPPKAQWLRGATISPDEIRSFLDAVQAEIRTLVQYDRAASLGGIHREAWLADRNPFQRTPFIIIAALAAIEFARQNRS